MARAAGLSRGERRKDVAVSYRGEYLPGYAQERLDAHAPESEILPELDSRAEQDTFWRTLGNYLPGYAALLFGRPVTVIQDGQIRQDALRHLRMTPGDLMEALRGKDIFDPRQVVWGVVEPSGSISAAQKVADDSPLLPLLVDQEVYPENLAQLGRNEAWLDTDLARRGMRRAEVLAYLGNKESCVVIQKKTAQNGRSEKPESTGGF